MSRDVSKIPVSISTCGFRDVENIFRVVFIVLFGCRSVLVISLNTARLYWLKGGA